MTDAVKTRYFRAWPLIVYAILCYFTTSTVASSMNIAAGVLEDARGWSAVAITSAISLASLANVAMGYIAGRACSRFSPRLICLVWGALYIAGVACMGVSRIFSLFIVSMVLANAAASAWGYNTVPVLITNWFPTKKGMVQGFVSMGIPLGAGFASMVYAWGLRTWGVDAAFLPFIIIAAITLVLLMLGISDMPENRGLTPDTMERCAVEAVPSASLGAGSADEPTRFFAPDLRFLLLSAVLGFQLLYSGGLMVQIAPRLFELGYTMDEAVLAMLVSAGFACAGSFICGAIGDKFGSKLGVTITFILGIAAIALNLIGNPVAVFVSLALIGVVTGSADNWPVNICAEAYGRIGFTKAFGTMFPIIQLVGAIGPSFFALIAGASGSYALSYGAGAVLMVIGLIAFLVLMRPGAQERGMSSGK